MLSGQALVGTPYSTPEHTMLHIEFMKSDRFKATAGQNQQIMQNFANHIMEENMAQIGRQKGINASGQGSLTPPPQSGASPEMMAMMGGGGVPGGGMMPEASGIMRGETKSVMPAMMRGSEMLPDFTGRGGAM